MLRGKSEELFISFLQIHSLSSHLVSFGCISSLPFLGFTSFWIAEHPHVSLPCFPGRDGQILRQLNMLGLPKILRQLNMPGLQILRASILLEISIYTLGDLVYRSCEHLCSRRFGRRRNRRTFDGSILSNESVKS
ncbi:hypothetical protein AMTRI_Chr11g151450 [Amborella trichopoda]